jgi:hypothetical protein
MAEKQLLPIEIESIFHFNAVNGWEEFKGWSVNGLRFNLGTSSTTSVIEHLETLIGPKGETVEEMCVISAKGLTDLQNLHIRRGKCAAIARSLSHKVVQQA